jgi:hypothetical protein
MVKRAVVAALALLGLILTTTVKRVLVVLVVGLFAPAVVRATDIQTSDASQPCDSLCGARMAITTHNLREYKGDHIRTGQCRGSRTRVVCHESETQDWGGCDHGICITLPLYLAWKDQATLRGGRWRVHELS